MTHTDRRTFVGTLGAAVASTTLPKAWAENTSVSDKQVSTAEKYTLAAYYFGNYHVDPINEAAHGP
ncbi:MAG: hypothetical protein H0U76_19920 [Ktedonobacteraceae bacterium]|nr:hypothetical protein [Ktedonobacteraceae bacterium]MBA3916097.1 hypothetical protein [Terriglobales bacterium]